MNDDDEHTPHDEIARLLHSHGPARMPDDAADRMDRAIDDAWIERPAQERRSWFGVRRAVLVGGAAAVVLVGVASALYSWDDDTSFVAEEPSTPATASSPAADAQPAEPAQKLELDDETFSGESAAGAVAADDPSAGAAMPELEGGAAERTSPSAANDTAAKAADLQELTDEDAAATAVSTVDQCLWVVQIFGPPASPASGLVGVIGRLVIAPCELDEPAARD